MSSFTWLDYSENEQRRMLDVISMFRESETRDELGIGAIRDAFADMFFPGTSTIQTRARYFLFVPWMYLKLEGRQITSREIANKARDEEIRLIRALKRSGINEGEGLIGARAENDLKRFPSNIYWQGLGQWQLRRFADSQSAYYRSLDRFYAHNQQIRVHNTQDEWREPLRHNWHPGLRDLLPQNFPDGMTLALTAQESAFLREQIVTHQANTLLAYLVAQPALWSKTDYPWTHPEHANFPERLQTQLLHARNFSEMILGASLLYNLMLAEKKAHPEWIELYHTEIQAWGQMVKDRQDDLTQWDWQEGFWRIVTEGNPRLSRLTRQFVEAWLALALASPDNLLNNQEARSLLHHRERHLKRNLARLDNPRALELWQGASGANQLNYRWSTAQTLISDILAGATHA